MVGTLTGVSKGRRLLGGAFGLAAACLLSATVVAEDAARGDGRLERSSLTLIGLDALEAAFLGAAGGGAAADDAEAAAPESSVPSFFKNWSLGGFLELGYNYNFSSPNSRENRIRIFDTRHNSFDLHHLNLSVSKAPVEGSWVGFDTQIMAGQDASVIHSAGLNTGDDFDVITANLQIKIPSEIGGTDVPGITDGTITVGKFLTYIGAEVINGPDNINYSRSILFGKAIPFVHTGFVYSNDTILDGMIGYHLGLTNGWDNVEDNNDGKAGIAGIKFVTCPYFDIGLNGIIGPEQDDNNSDNRGLIDIVFNAKVLDTGLSFVGNFDYGAEENASAINGNYAKWYGMSGILKYDFAALDLGCECLDDWYAALRGEVFWDPDGARIGETNLTPPAIGNFAKRYSEITLTLGWRPFSDLLVRFEYRWDKADEKIFEDGSDDDDKSSQSTLAANIIYQF